MNYDLYDQHQVLYDALCDEQNARVDGCTCTATMTNAGTSGMFTGYDSQGCPLHCEHRGINKNGAWRCNCGARG